MAYQRVPLELRKRPVYVERQVVTDMLTDTSLCTRCQQTKLVSCFKLRFVQRKGGHVAESWCKECKQADIEEYRKKPEAMAANNERVKAYIKTEEGSVKRAIYVQKYGKDPINKVTMQRQHKRYYAQPHVQQKAAVQANARRVTEEAGTLAPGQWRAVLNAWGYTCAYCKKTQKSLGLRRLCLEHVKALSLGGGHDMDNVVPACTSCNSKKRDLPIEEALKRFSIDALAWQSAREEKLKAARKIYRTKENL